jgi:ankyrin repeat protein
MKQYVELVHNFLSFYEGGDSSDDVQVREMISTLPQKALEICNNDGDTLMLTACHYSACDLLYPLLEKGSNVNAQNHKGYTCLHIACLLDLGSVAIVQVSLFSILSPMH